MSSSVTLAETRGTLPPNECCSPPRDEYSHSLKHPSNQRVDFSKGLLSLLGGIHFKPQSEARALEANCYAFLRAARCVRRAGRVGATFRYPHLNRPMFKLGSSIGRHALSPIDRPSFLLF